MSVLFCFFARNPTGNGSAVAGVRRMATWCPKQKGRAEVILCLLSPAEMPSTLRYTFGNINPEETAGPLLLDQFLKVKFCTAVVRTHVINYPKHSIELK